MSSQPERQKEIKHAILSAMVHLPWGAWSFTCLCISLISGIVVGLQYDYATPYYSITSIDLLVPFGSFFRSLHFYSSQFFLLCTIAHLIATYPKAKQFPQSEWYKLTILLPIIIFLLFTGYVLRADSTGASAGAIAQSILQAIPLVGRFFDEFFFGLESSGLRRVYVHHVISLDLLLLFLAWQHLRAYRVNPLKYPNLLVLTLIFCAIIAAPLEPEDPTAGYITGPWFFLGLQELLRYLHPLVAGVLYPLILVFLIIGIHPEKKNSQRYLLLVWLWLGLYSILTAIAWFR
jgi:ubiquinol-cytochrome c reductase cytochrome b subunit